MSLFVFPLPFFSPPFSISSRHPTPESFPSSSCLGQTEVEIENRLPDCQALFTHTHSHICTATQSCHEGLKCKLPPHTPSTPLLTHTPSAGLGAVADSASDSVLWNPSGPASVIVYNCPPSAGPALVKSCGADPPVFTAQRLQSACTGITTDRQINRLFPLRSPQSLYNPLLSSSPPSPPSLPVFPFSPLQKCASYRQS